MAHRIRPLVLSVALAAAVLGSRSARAEDAPAPAPNAPDGAAKPPPAPAPLPGGVIARVRGKDLSTDDFRTRLARRVQPELDETRSGPYGVLRILVEEMVVLQEAERLGIRVSSEDYGRTYDAYDRRVRDQSRGTQTLADVIRLQKMSAEEFRLRLEDSIRKERIASHPTNLGDSLPKEETARLAQIEIVMAALMKKAKVERAGVPAGVVATVNGQPITEDAFGRALMSRLGESEVRRHLNEECLTLLLDQEGLEVTEAQVDEALALDRPVFERMRVDAVTPERRSLTFDAFLQLRYGAPVAELRASRYRRGLFALRQRFWKTIDEDAVRAAWVRGSKGAYGPSILLTDVMISFTVPKAVVASVQRRTRDEALRLAEDVLRRVRGGESADAVVKEVRDRKDRSFVAERRAVVDEGNDLPLFAAAREIPDGTWTGPVEGLSEVHVLRRESLRPAPTFDEIRDVVRQHLVDEKAQAWLQETMRDQVRVAR